MTVETQGTVSVTISDDITWPEKAGGLSIDEVRRLTKPRRGLTLACIATADAMQKNPERLKPHNVAADKLAKLGDSVEKISMTLVDIDAVTAKMKQAGLILEVEAHDELRKVLAFVRSQIKFDPRITDLVPHLMEYFSNDRPPRNGDPVVNSK
jgi:hypothetical protein